MADGRDRFTGQRKQLGVSLGEGWHSSPGAAGAGFLEEAREHGRYLKPSGLPGRHFRVCIVVHWASSQVEGYYLALLYTDCCWGCLGRIREKPPIPSFFLVLSVSVQYSEIVCVEEEEEQVPGSACCVRGWISTSSSHVFVFH